MDEHGYIRSIHRKLPNRIFVWKINANFARGVPDAWYSGPTGDVWVEYKFRPTTPRRRFNPGLSPHQRRWLNHRKAEGRQVAAIIGCPEGALILADGAWDQDKITPPEEWATAGDVISWLENQTCYDSTHATAAAESIAS